VAAAHRRGGTGGADRQRAPRPGRAGRPRIAVAPGNRPPLPLAPLGAAGVAVGLGCDGIRDLWSPWGDGDLLGRAALLAWRAGARRQQELAAALELATPGGAAVLRLDGHGLALAAGRPHPGPGRDLLRGGGGPPAPLPGAQARPGGRRPLIPLSRPAPPGPAAGTAAAASPRWSSWPGRRRRWCSWPAGSRGG
jgi:hypothetical protein